MPDNDPAVLSRFNHQLDGITAAQGWSYRSVSQLALQYITRNIETRNGFLLFVTEIANNERAECDEAPLDPPQYE